MRTATLLTLLGLVLLSSCELPRSNRPTRDDMAVSETFSSLDRRLIWEVVVVEIGRGGLTLDREQSSEATGEFETLWVEYLAPFRHEGIRKKLVGAIEEVPDQPGAFRLRAITWVQRNADVKDPLDPSKAIWQDIEPDETTTEEFIYRVRGHFAE